LGTTFRAPTEKFGKPVPNSLPTIVHSFKSAVTKQINIIRNMFGMPVWQRNYYEHIIRNEREMNKIQEYIINNPIKWDLDKENPINKQKRFI
jgi:REP element-mobilizing transposase RayT